MVEDGHRLYPSLQQCVDQPVVETQALFVYLAPALGQDPGPGDRKAEGADAELAQQGDVVAVPVVEIAGDRPAFAAGHIALAHSPLPYNCLPESRQWRRRPSRAALRTQRAVAAEQGVHRMNLMVMVWPM